jgi:hypothetical protein
VIGRGFKAEVIRHDSRLRALRDALETVLEEDHTCVLMNLSRYGGIATDESDQVKWS